LAYEGTYRSALNTFVTCMFLPWSHARMTEVINAVTGWNTTFFEVFKVGERSVNLPRVFNLREGLTAEDDKLPKRFFETHTAGPLAGFQYDPAKVERAKLKYYEMMGWTREGVPTEAKLAELNVGWAAQELPR
jgi:aldehyde:ferredoxin oxidoreductase